jgi:tol-pal system protein YbgF
MAQNSTVRALVERLNRLEDDLATVQRRLAREGVPVAGAEKPAGSITARHESRIGQLEEQVRTLTGQIEEAEFRIRQLSDGLEQRVANAEQRLAALEARIATATVAGGRAIRRPADNALPGSAARAVPDIGANDVPGESKIVAVAPDPNAENYDTMGVLGRIPSEGDVAAVVPPVAPEPAPPAAADPQAAYDSAYQLLRQADYDQAEVQLQRFIDAFPEHQLAGNAYYWLGETFYVRNNYEQAAISFARGYKSFPAGSKAPDNLLKLGMAFYGMGKTTEACATFSKLQADHPDAPSVIRDRLRRERQKAQCS